MSRVSFRKIMLVAAGALSLCAQGILLIPTALSFFLRYLVRSSLAGEVSGIILFALAVLLFALIGFHPNHDKQRQRINGMLLVTQVCTVLGIYILLGDLAPGERGAGFVLSS